MLAGGAGLALAAIAGCSNGGSTSSGSTTSSGSKLEKTSLTVATVPAVTNMGMFIADKFGYFHEEGLDLTIKVVPTSTTAVDDQIHGSVDITAGAYVSYIADQAKSSGVVQWKVLNEGSISQPGSQQVLVSSKSSIKKISDLKGKKIGANALDNVGQLLVQSVMSENGISPDEYTVVAVAFPDMAGSLQNGSIDAGWFDEPFLTSAQMTIGAKTLFDTCQGATTDFPMSGYMATKSWAEKYPNTAAAFVRAVNKGQQLADSNRTDAQKTCESAIKGVTAEVASALTFDSYPTGIDQTRLQRVSNVMKQFGLLTKQFDVSAMI
ncbi:MAG TPA: ABC transporter substrate-binding protein [Trebonia sp.]|nr:ABC transporter substrate-binding protein [Trebonia sp.]